MVYWYCRWDLWPFCRLPIRVVVATLQMLSRNNLQFKIGLIWPRMTGNGLWIMFVVWMMFAAAKWGSTISAPEICCHMSGPWTKSKKITICHHTHVIHKTTSASISTQYLRIQRQLARAGMARHSWHIVCIACDRRDRGWEYYKQIQINEQATAVIAKSHGFLTIHRHRQTRPPTFRFLYKRVHGYLYTVSICIYRSIAALYTMMLVRIAFVMYKYTRSTYNATWYIIYTQTYTHNTIIYAAMPI